MSRKRKILSVKNLDFSYNQNKVLDNISFSVEEGSFISILGPNGSGKSTLVNLISKVLIGYEGKIEVGGRDIRKLNPKDIAKNGGCSAPVYQSGL